MNNVKVYASAGLIVIAVVHALVFGLVLSSNQAQLVKQTQPPVVHVPQLVPQPEYPQMSGPTNGLNTGALNENKQGTGCDACLQPKHGRACAGTE